MKIGFVSTFFTGATLPLCNYLSKRGHNIDFYKFAMYGSFKEENLQYDAPVRTNKIQQIVKENLIYQYIDKSIRLFVVPFFIVRHRRYLIGYWNYYKNYITLRRLENQIRNNVYDIIYIIVNEEHDYMLVKRLKKKGLKNIIVAYHEVTTGHIGNPQLKSVVRKTVNLGSPIVTYSKSVQQVLYQLTKVNSRVIYFGPFEAYKLYDTSTPIVSEDYILFIGIITAYKGLPFLYETIMEYGKELPLKVVVAGGGYDSVLEKMSGDSRFILINRFLSDMEFANLVKFARCVICPYVAGSQSGITHTAMVFGTPVIATKVGAFPEFIVEGENGYLVDYGDKAQLYEKIEIVASRSKKSIDYIPSYLQWDNIVKSFERCCVELKH